MWLGNWNLILSPRIPEMALLSTTGAQLSAPLGSILFLAALGLHCCMAGLLYFAVQGLFMAVVSLVAGTPGHMGSVVVLTCSVALQSM